MDLGRVESGRFLRRQPAPPVSASSSSSSALQELERQLAAVRCTASAAEARAQTLERGQTRSDERLLTAARLLEVLQEQLEAQARASARAIALLEARVRELELGSAQRKRTAPALEAPPVDAQRPGALPVLVHEPAAVDAAFFSAAAAEAEARRARLRSLFAASG